MRLVLMLEWETLKPEVVFLPVMRQDLDIDRLGDPSSFEGLLLRMTGFLSCIIECQFRRKYRQARDFCPVEYDKLVWYACA